VFLSKAFGIRSGEPESLVMVKSLLSHHDVYQSEFSRELDLFSRVNHEHVVRLLGVCRDVEPLFLITEYCEWVSTKYRATCVQYPLEDFRVLLRTVQNLYGLKVCLLIKTDLKWLARPCD